MCDAIFVVIAANFRDGVTAHNAAVAYEECAVLSFFESILRFWEWHVSMKPSLFILIILSIICPLNAHDHNIIIIRNYGLYFGAKY